MIENPGEGIDSVLSSVDFVLGANVENLTLTGSGNIAGTGNALSNFISGNAGNNWIDGGAGADFMYGGAGNDTYVVDDVGDVVGEGANEGIDTVLSSVTFSLVGTQVENLVLTGTAAPDATGNELDNVLIGNAAANVLDGGTGADTLSGGGGDDVYVVDDVRDVVVEAAGGGVDVVRSAVSFTLAPNVENLVLTGHGDLDGTGNGNANVLTGNDGRNTLDGGAGADTMVGGRGDDTYVVDAAGDVVVELANEGVDTVRASVTFTLAAEVENLVLTGSTNSDGYGNDLPNVLTGNAGNNLLDGGAGADTMTGGAGDDTYIVDNATATWSTKLAGEGNDTVHLLRRLLARRTMSRT